MTEYTRVGSYPRVRESHFGFMASWANALHGQGDLNTVLKELVGLTGAQAAKISRLASREATPRIVAGCDVEAARLLRAAGQDCFAGPILGEAMFSARRGSVWLMSEAGEGPGGLDQRQLASMAAAHGVIEVAVVILSNGASGADCLELHFRGRPAPHNLDLLKIMAQAMCRCWDVRRPGLATSYANRGRLRLVSDKGEERHVDIFDPSNPMKLSRCEFRVCFLLKEGLRVKAIARELSVCEATVRSHLSSIYGKIGVASQVELLHRLNAAGAEAPSGRRAEGA